MWSGLHGNAISSQHLNLSSRMLQITRGGSLHFCAMWLPWLSSASRVGALEFAMRGSPSGSYNFYVSSHRFHIALIIHWKLHLKKHHNPLDYHALSDMRVICFWFRFASEGANTHEGPKAPCDRVYRSPLICVPYSFGISSIQIIPYPSASLFKDSVE